MGGVFADISRLSEVVPCRKSAVSNPNVRGKHCRVGGDIDRVNYSSKTVMATDGGVIGLISKSRHFLENRTRRSQVESCRTSFSTYSFYAHKSGTSPLILLLRELDDEGRGSRRMTFRSGRDSPETLKETTPTAGNDIWSLNWTPLVVLSNQRGRVELWSVEFSFAWWTRRDMRTKTIPERFARWMIWYFTRSRYKLTETWHDHILDNNLRRTFAEEENREQNNLKCINQRAFDDDA